MSEVTRLQTLETFDVMSCNQLHSLHRRRRSRSPHERLDSRRPPKRRRESPAVHDTLPFHQRTLDKRDLNEYRSLFAEYLDIQKGIYLGDLDYYELRGRWKSFTGKWNRGELAEGWYDPAFKIRVDARPPRQHEEDMITSREQRKSAVSDLDSNRAYHQDSTATMIGEGEDIENESEDDEFGPIPPDFTLDTQPLRPIATVSIPTMQDLELQREQSEHDRREAAADRRWEQKMARRLDKERDDELVPQAQPGSRERQLEKKREVAASNRAFRDAKSPGAEEVNDRELMGGGEMDSFKAQKRAQERRKNEREIRKEEVLRARAAEREERLREHRQKEEKTMAVFKALAKQKFG